MTTTQLDAFVNHVLAHNRERVCLHEAAQATDRARLAQQRHTPALDEQIEHLMRELPPAQRDRCWSMAELLPRLSGKYRDRPHAKEVGQALRRLGWHRERRYGHGFDGTRVWLPTSPSLT